MSCFLITLNKCLKQRPQPVQIICICPDICAFSVLDNRHCADICAFCEKCQFEVEKYCCFSQRLMTCIVNKQTLPHENIQPEAPASSEFLSLLRISEFFGFQWQNLTEILRLLPKVLQSENEAVIMITSPLYNICLQQM